jgi:hypothetical protein
MHDASRFQKARAYAESRAKTQSRHEDLNTVAQGFSILLFYTICTFYSQTRPNAAKAETNKTIVVIERISGCIP